MNTYSIQYLALPKNVYSFIIECIILSNYLKLKRQVVYIYTYNEMFCLLVLHNKKKEDLNTYLFSQANKAAHKKVCFPEMQYEI